MTKPNQSLITSKHVEPTLLFFQTQCGYYKRFTIAATLSPLFDAVTNDNVWVVILNITADDRPTNNELVIPSNRHELLKEIALT